MLAASAAGARPVQRTTRTGTGARLTTPSATLPTTIRSTVPTPRAPTTSTSASAAARSSSSTARPSWTSVFTRHPARVRRSRAASSCRWARGDVLLLEACRLAGHHGSNASGEEARGRRSDGLHDAEEPHAAAARQREPRDERDGRPRVRGAVDPDQEPPGRPGRSTHHEHGGPCLPHDGSAHAAEEEAADGAEPAGAQDQHSSPDLSGPRQDARHRRQVGDEDLRVRPAAPESPLRAAGLGAAHLEERVPDGRRGVGQHGSGPRDDAVTGAAPGPREGDRGLDRGAGLGTAVGRHQHRKAALCHGSPRAGSHRPAECNRRGRRAGSGRPDALVPHEDRGVPSLRIPSGEPGGPGGG